MDVHDISHILIRAVNAPVLLHISTVKGKGYDFAEKSPSTYHGISKFNVETGEPVSSGANFSSVFGDELCTLATENNKVCAITAAMALGTGLKDFLEKFADRFYDVGIAEEHAVTFASGLAKGGMIPVVALYSTFLQRAYDQLVHDGTLQEQKVIIGVDRAGFVGEDGVTHQGLLDVSLINSIPNATMYSPFTFEILRKDLRNAVNNASNLTIIRYPRGGEIKIPNTYVITDSEFDYFDNNSSKLIVSYGRVTAEVINAVEQLKNKGINFSIISLNKIKPISDEVYDIALKYSEIYFYEESVRSGSIGQSFADILCERCYNGRYEHIAVNDSFVAHATVKSLLKKYKLDTESIVEKFSEK